MFVFLTILFIVLGIGSIVLRLFNPETDSGDKRGKVWYPIGTVLVVIGLLFTAFYTVPVGYRGVQQRFGRVIGVSSVGLNFKLPIIDSITLMSVQTQLYKVETGAASMDLQDVTTQLELNYNLNPAMVDAVYSGIGMSYPDLVVKPAVPEAVKSVTAKFNAEDLIRQRDTVKQGIIQALRDRLESRGIVIETINMTDFDFSAEFNNAIEAKMVAQQDALQAENKLKQIEVEARQVETAAKGQANATIAKAQGDAQSITINAEAQAMANKKISESLTDALVRYTMIQKLSPDVKVIMLPSDQGLLLSSDLLK